MSTAHSNPRPATSLSAAARRRPRLQRAAHTGLAAERIARSILRYGNEYITRHLPVKAGVPQYEWVEPPTGPQHPGVVFVPPTGAQLSARNSPRSLGMNYPMAEAKGGFPGRNTASRS